MERLEQYRQCIRKLLTEQATMEAGNPDIECQLIFDAEHDLGHQGWQDLDSEQLKIHSSYLVIFLP